MTQPDGSCIIYPGLISQRLEKMRAERAAEGGRESEKIRFPQIRAVTLKQIAFKFVNDLVSLSALIMQITRVNSSLSSPISLRSIGMNA